MGLEIVSMLLIYATQLWDADAEPSDADARHRWTSFVTAIGDALLHVGAANVPQLDIALLTLEPFHQVPTFSTITPQNSLGPNILVEDCSTPHVASVEPSPSGPILVDWALTETDRS